ncbi:MAG: DMT family transporter [Candidatus Thiodiazotropha sp.]
MPNATLKLTLLTTLVMLAFAANSLLCREALTSDGIGAASFTLIRLVSGAAVLWLLIFIRHRRTHVEGDWLSAAALFGYAAGFSYAYLNLSAGSGALLLFGAVQLTMISYGILKGERLSRWQILGALSAFGGLIWLVMPGVTTPPLFSAMLMIGAGISWGIYSLRGRAAQEPTLATAGNFARSVPFAVLLFMLLWGQNETVTETGVLYALASDAIASGLGYALWYAVLPALASTTAATLQLSVPVIAALGGALLLGEAFTLRFGIAAITVLGGLLVFILNQPRIK